MALSFWRDSFFSSPVEDMERVFDNFFQQQQRSTKMKELSWRPACDLRETEKEILVHAEVPGVSKENINLELKDNVLTIHGEKKHELKEENEKMHRVERVYGRFSRSIMMPDGVSEKDIKAAFKDGVLEVSIAKPEKKIPELKKINIE